MMKRRTTSAKRAATRSGVGAVVLAAAMTAGLAACGDSAPAVSLMSLKPTHNDVGDSQVSPPKTKDACDHALGKPADAAKKVGLDVPDSLKWTTSTNSDPNPPFAVGRATTPSGESGVKVECKIVGPKQAELDITVVEKIADLAEFFNDNTYMTSTKQPAIAADYSVSPSSGDPTPAQTAAAKKLAQHAADVSKP